MQAPTDGKQSSSLCHLRKKFRKGRGMKLIQAIIKPFRLDRVRAALMKIGVQGLTITEARGFRRQRGQKEIYRGAEYEMIFLPKIRLDALLATILPSKQLTQFVTLLRPGRSVMGKYLYLIWKQRFGSAPEKNR